MKDELKRYKKDEVYYTPIMNLLMNNRSKDWYAELGKYITETLDISKIPELSFFVGKVGKKSGLIARFKDFISPESRMYGSIFIHFQTSVLNAEALENMFGKPIFHDEFGEGFDGEWNEETAEYDEPGIKESYASYFVNLGGTNFHIGYDHRGTEIEIETPSKFQYDGKGIPDEDARKCFESVKKLIDLYKQKN